MSGKQKASATPVRLAPRTVHAPRGGKLSCKGWHQEAAMRMLMNNLDPDVAENPDQLVVYGGTGGGARGWGAVGGLVGFFLAPGGGGVLFVLYRITLGAIRS